MVITADDPVTGVRHTADVEQASQPRYRVPADIAWVDGTEIGLGEELYLARLPSGSTVQLVGTARMIWHAAIGSDDPVEAVSALVGQPIGSVRAAVNGFLDELAQNRLIVGDPR